MRLPERSRPLRLEDSGAVPAQVPILSDRQREVLHWVAMGLTDQEIGAELGISARTVRMHCDALRWKFNVAHRRHLLPIYDRRVRSEPRPPNATTGVGSGTENV